MGVGFIAAQVAVAVIQVGAPPFSERVLREAPTAGENVLGVTATLRDPVTSSMTVSGLTNTDAYLCANLRSVSGLYEASFVVANPKRGSVVRLDLPTQTPSRLKLRSGEVAVRVRPSASSDCSARGAYLPVAWGTAGPSNLVALLVNSRQADRVRVRVAGGAPVPCQKIGDAVGLSGLGARAYDYACHVQLSASCAADNAVQIVLNDSNSIRTPIEIAVRSAC